MKEGGEVELKDDSEYPDWLWTLNTGKWPLKFCKNLSDFNLQWVNVLLVHFEFVGPALPLDQMDPDTEEYWIKARQLSNKRSTSMMRLRKFQ